MPLPPLESKMWNYLIETQITNNNTIRTKGSWPSYSRFHGTSVHSLESNSFVTTQLLLALLEINKNYELPNSDLVYIKANQFLNTFIEDSITTNEPAGTIAYWPLIETPSGKWIRSFSAKIPYRNLKVFNVPNDLDASANLFLWYLKTNQNSNYLNGFIKTVGKYIDTDREQIYPNDMNWKNNNSGAFLTWAEPDRNIKYDSRIFKGINDVDCVVNLNILTALFSARNFGQELSESTTQTVKDSCRLINETVNKNLINKCGVWYDRPSQFFTAYSKTFSAQKNENDCLSQSSTRAHKKLIELATLSLSKKENLTETAEYLSSIKRMWPKNYRDKIINTLIIFLDLKLRNSIIEESNTAYLNNTESLFIAKIGPIKVEWYSKEFSTALTLQSILMP